MTPKRVRKISVIAIFAILAAMIGLSLWAWSTQHALIQNNHHHMSVETAHAKAKKGSIVLVDVRRASEWRQTGIPAGAHAITMHQNRQNFLAQLREVAGTGKAARPIALICARGGRTSYLMRDLANAGFENLINVTEGALGSRYGPGWLAKGLPVRTWPGPRTARP